MNRQKILVTDPIYPHAITTLENAGFAVHQKSNLSKKELLNMIESYDALICRTSTKIDADIMKAAKKLKCIGVHATGWDHIDIDAATKQGIALLGFPTNQDTIKKDRQIGSFIPTAEHTLLMMLAAAGNFNDMCNSMKQEKWEKYNFNGTELYQKTLGIIGLGRIGSLVASRAKAFGMHIIAYDPNIDKDKAKKRDAELVTFEKLLQTSDFITIHVHKTKNTEKLLDASAFEQMKQGVIIINTARASIIDANALAQAIENKTVRAAMLDVHDGIPENVNWKLIQKREVQATPHIAGVSEESLERVSMHVVQSIIDFLKNGKSKNLINKELEK